MNPHSPEHGSIRPPHPLALVLAARLRPGARLLEIGTGSGRNARALSAAGFEVRSFEREPFPAGPFAGAVSTHALLHGTAAQIAQTLELVAERLEPHSPLAATFGSTSDTRYGRGSQIDAFTFALNDGDERGIPHTFFDRPRLRALLAPHFILESYREETVDKIAGTWAHKTTPLIGAIHWFVVAIRR